MGSVVKGVLGGGAKVSTAGAEAATDKSLALQEKIYNDSQAMTKPYYQAGTASLSRLMELLGLESGMGAPGTPQLFSEQIVKNNTKAVNLSPEEARQRAILSYQRLGQSLEEATRNADAALKNPGTMDAYRKTMIDYDAIDKQLGEQNTANFNYANREKPDDYGSLTKKFSAEDFQVDPGYAFRQEQGNIGIERALAAQGKTLDPRAQKALMEYNQGLASQEYGAAYDRYNNDQSQLFNRLASISGLGQTASQERSTVGANYANQATNLYTGLANQQQAAAESNANRAGGSLFGKLANAGINAGLNYVTGGGWGAVKGATGGGGLLPWQSPGSINPSGGFY